MATVSLQEVSKTIEGNTVLDGLSFTIERGEFIVVVGPSGCGKSTLLRCIAGLESITSGSLLINDQCMNQVPAAKRDMAMVFQSYALYPHMTVYENLAYGLKMRKTSKDQIDKLVHWVAELLNLANFLQRKPQALSGGQRQRVAMGRALVRKPSVYLFDEPLSNLDSQLRTQMRHEIRKLHQQMNTTSIYVTHDQTEAMTMAERIVVLNQGKIEQIDTPEILYKKPDSLFVASFIGHYSMNFIPGRVSDNMTHVTSTSGLNYLFSSDQPLHPGQEVILAIRAEDIRLNEGDHHNVLTLKVDTIDELGCEKLVYGQDKKTGLDITVRAPASWVAASEVAAYFPAHPMHVFDKKTGKRLGEINA